MRLIPERLRTLYRRHFGSVSIDDPRPIAAESPYTFYRPSENELLAIAPGDIVKIIIRSRPRSFEWGAERMWVVVTEANGDQLSGTLDNDPLDMPQLKHGSTLSFCRSDVINIDWNEQRRDPPPSAPTRREYWDRCIVDQCVLDGVARVHFLYRENGDLGQENDPNPDSGWRIRGDYRGLSDAEIEARDTAYVALGAVLNRDDSWLHLIDMPTGSAFIRDWATDMFVVEEEGASNAE